MDPQTAAILAALAYETPGSLIWSDLVALLPTASVPNKGTISPWAVITQQDVAVDGYHGIAFFNQATGQVAIVNRGSSNLIDCGVSDADIANQVVPPAFGDAKQFYEHIRSLFPNATGSSPPRNGSMMAMPW